jgi:hypothetical protein
LACYRGDTDMRANRPSKRLERRLQEYNEKDRRCHCQYLGQGTGDRRDCHEEANQAALVIGEKMKSLASAIREKASRLATSASKVADG